MRVKANRKWVKANPDKVRAMPSSSKAARAAVMRKYYATHPEVFSRMRQARRARMKNDVRLIASRDWERLIARYDHRCAYCHERKPLTRDHIIPLRRGGRHSIGNLIPACRECNGSKSALLLVEWRVKRLALS